MKPDLTDQELDELDTLLSTSPVPALNALMLDGFLAGVLVQPQVVPIDEWLPKLFEQEDGTGLPPDTDPAWLARVRELAERHRDALNASMSEDGWFNPLVVDVEREPPQSEYEANDLLSQLPDTSRALVPWVAGFQWAMDSFSPEYISDTEALLLARIYRHLPPENDDDKEATALLDRTRPLPTVDAAVDELVSAVVELWDFTAKQRFAVKTIHREHPKLGRNDPCFCGSGKKYKVCHGR